MVLMQEMDDWTVEALRVESLACFEAPDTDGSVGEAGDDRAWRARNDGGHGTGFCISAGEDSLAFRSVPSPDFDAAVGES